MEHITVIELGNGYKKLTPDSGYYLKYKDRIYSEAIVKDTVYWNTVPMN